MWFSDMTNVPQIYFFHVLNVASVNPTFTRRKFVIDNNSVKHSVDPKGMTQFQAAIFMLITVRISHHKETC
jgi:hypothetical protein